MGTAPRRPAQEMNACWAHGIRNQTRLSTTDSGRAISSSAPPTSSAGPERVGQARRRGEQAEQHEQADLGERGHALGEADAGRAVRQRALPSTTPHR